jgi:hypothetical protein
MICISDRFSMSISIFCRVCIQNCKAYRSILEESVLPVGRAQAQKKIERST